MTDLEDPTQKQDGVLSWIGMILIRLVVPAWIFIGAFTKAQGATPKSLPRSILDAGGLIGFEDHHLLLTVLVAIEFAFVSVMLFVPRLARIAATTMLGTFLVVLLIEMFAYGNFESCGCLGDHSLSPIIMFTVDFLLLLGVVIFKPLQISCNMCNGNRGIIAAIVFVILSWGYTISNIANAKNSGVSNHKDLPASWYPTDIGSWTGKSIDDIELFSWVDWPKDIHDGKQYVIFFGRTCDHCEALLYMHFEFDLRVPTTLVAIPDAKDGFNDEGAFENPCFDCLETELPIGVDWIIGTPMVVAIENGTVRCAVEGEDSEVPACLIW